MGTGAGDKMQSIVTEIKKHHSEVAQTNKEKETATVQQKVQDPMQQKAVEPVTLKDLHKDLQDLNKNIMQMVHHTAAISDHSGKQVKATKSLSGNGFD
jgi:pyruvate-formate lyase